MMDLNTMRRENKKAEATATQPIPLGSSKRIPYTGSKKFALWEPATLEDLDLPEVLAQADSESPIIFFVDTSGFGEKGEGALTQEELLNIIDQIEEKHSGQFGVGLSFFGEFQGWVTLYKKRACRT